MTLAITDEEVLRARDRFIGWLRGTLATAASGARPNWRDASL
jgi:hypothetical protein